MTIGESRLSLVVAASLLAVAFAHAVSLTCTLSWPAGPDMMRDVAAAHAVQQSFARSIKRAVPLIDPYYRGEAFWYNPLVPAIVAALSQLTGRPVQVVAARAGAYLNLLTPLTFYFLAWVLFGPLVAVAALAVFLYVEPFSSWQGATYSPWLVVSNFAQAFFYAGVIAWMRFERTPRAASAVLTGVAIGASFLVHTAPAVLLAAMFTAGLVAKASDPGRDLRWFDLIARGMLVIATAALVAIPTLSTIVHYRGRVVQPLPFLWLDPSMELENLGRFVMQNVRQFLFTGLTVVGFVVLVRGGPSRGRRVLLVWLALTVALFAWSAYAWRILRWPVVIRLSVVPAHHFLVYFRAAQSMLCGIAVATIANVMGERLTILGRARALCLVAAIVVAAGVPSYRGREDFTSYFEMARTAFTDPFQRSVTEWIARKTAPNDVFLAPQSASFSMVGVVGRKAVLVERFFSNPYVEWYGRQRDMEAMWAAIAGARCDAFADTADRYRVSYVLAVAPLTPRIEPNVCGLQQVFAAGVFTIYSRVGRRAED